MLRLRQQMQLAADRHTAAVDTVSPSRVGVLIFVAAAAGLFMELMINRIHGSYLQFFSYFKNISLLSCFLGLGIGYARGEAKRLYTAAVIPMLCLQILLIHYLSRNPDVDFLRNPVSGQIAFGLSGVSGAGPLIQVYLFLIFVFSLNVVCFIPLGQIASRLMQRQERLVSYGWNLAGSLGGIVLFTAVSFLETPPSIWMGIAFVFLAVLSLGDRRSLWPAGLALAAVLAVLTMSADAKQLTCYSPYQKLTLEAAPNNGWVMQANNSFHQNIQDFRDGAIAGRRDLTALADCYALPYRYKPSPGRVLVVGSGTGNDVAAALRNGAQEVDAVEIDPRILRFGKELHPESPYQNPKVRVIVDDARNFIRRTDRRYDVIVYGLLDSHSLLSGRSGGIRLESYVYTVEAFREARQKLKQAGIVCLSFAVIKPELGQKIYLMMRDVFEGQDPVVYWSTTQSAIFLVGEGVRQGLAAALPPSVFNVTDRYRRASVKADLSTDDWPFLYVSDRGYPLSYLALLGVLFGISFLYLFASDRKFCVDFSWPCFFLGAGFMLVETKGFTELALVFGSTWLVLSVMIAAVLILAFCANALILKRGHPKRVWTYGLLCLSLVAGAARSFCDPKGLDPVVYQIFVTLILTLPFFFSGFAFSAELDESSSVGKAMSANLLGAMLGGFLEYNSLYFGFRSLYFFAIAMYALAYFLAPRSRR
ncbi:MAG: hypothetical protein WCG06_01760 [Candidatus Omnitrophota bacterium]